MKIDEAKSIIDGVDFYAKTMEKKWGVERLRLLVDDELRSRFDTQRKLFNDAVWDQNNLGLREHAEAMMRGWKALDEAARIAGAKPLKPEVWEVRMPSGKVCAVVKTNTEAHHICDDERWVEVWTLEEIGRLIEGPWRDVGKAKEVFPGALVIDVKTGGKNPNDDIPF
tara:strand:- start:1275 stop:1778 length:504 start_codon:yes stop_codon:yes gene_type:complete